MRRHILLIDDDSEEMQLFCAGLDEAGIDYQCTWTENVHQALTLLETLQPDLIFIDLNMPAINGLQGIRLIRENELSADIPLILYSTSIDAVTGEEARRLGASFCFEKPASLRAFTRPMQMLFAGLNIPKRGD